MWKDDKNINSKAQPQEMSRIEEKKLRAACFIIVRETSIEAVKLKR